MLLRITAIKLQAEPINILMVQVHMPTSEHEDDEVEELYGVTEEILEEDGKGNTNTIIMGDGNSVFLCLVDRVSFANTFVSFPT